MSTRCSVAGSWDAPIAVTPKIDSSRNAASSAQPPAWLAEFGVPAPSVNTLPIREVVPDAVVDGSADELADQVLEPDRWCYTQGTS